MAIPPSPTLIYHHPAFTGHDTTPHPENPARVNAIELELRARNLLHNRQAPTWSPATDEHILRAHDASMLQRLEHLTRTGGGAIDPDTVVFPDSLNAARISAGAAVHAIEEIRNGAATSGFVLGRPPGHHATHDQSMGFCLINTIAIAALHARAIGYERVAIIDWDVHHGNGTQDILYDRPDVLFCSMHRYGWPFFPGSGSADQRGVGPGSGFTLNIPLQAGDGDAEVISALSDHIAPTVRQFAPDIILLSAGYDAHVEDPLGGLNVTDDGFRTLTTITRDLARELTGGRLLAILEGGYHPEATARCVADSISILDGTVL